MFDPIKLELLIGPAPDAQRHVLEKLVQELRTALPAMQDACRDQQWQVVRNYAHKYRGTAAVIGATSCAEVLAQLEKTIVVSQTQPVTQLLDSLGQAIGDFEGAVNAHLQELDGSSDMHKPR